MIAEKSRDTLPAAKLGMWFFLASEAMFFVGLLGAFAVLGSTGGQHQLFVKSAAMLSPVIGIASGILLAISSYALRSTPSAFTWFALFFGTIFINAQIAQAILLTDHHTCIARVGQSTYVYDWNEPRTSKTNARTGYRMEFRNGLDLHTLTESDFPANPEAISFDGAQILQSLNYGLSRNNFFACFFLLSAVHCLHLLAGLIALAWFEIFAKGKIPSSLQIYWHFVNAVGVISLAVLYFV